MSWSASRRSGAGNVSATTGKVTIVPGKCTSAAIGKENVRPLSRIRPSLQKPSSRTTAPMDDLNPRARRSTSSVPRGRSASPVEFRRTFSDVRKKPSVPDSSLCKGNNSEKRRDSKNLNVIDIAVDGSSANRKKEFNLGSMLVRNKTMLESCSNKPGRKEQVSHVFQSSSKRSDMRISVGSSTKGQGKEYDLRLSSSERPDLYLGKEKIISGLSPKIGASLGMKLRTSDIGVEVSSSLRKSKLEEKASSSSREKYPSKYRSKLHDRLADLQGKVKQTASDLNRTKEMLDMNNTDASKMILSDIQEKISGIEKAMVNVVKHDQDEIRRNVVCENGDKSSKSAVEAQVHLQGLIAEKLEDRLFPHHKLIRGRTLIKSSVGDSSASTEGNLVSGVIATALECSNPSIEIEKDSVSDSTEAREIVTSTAKCSSLNVLGSKTENIDSLLLSDETFKDYDEENFTEMIIDEEDSKFQLNDIGIKSSTAGWFVSEGDSVLLAHDDGTCSFYDIANCEEKAEYKPPSSIYPNLWRDCWIIRAPGADGCTGKYVVAASAGNSGESGFCSWDFYNKSIRAFHSESDSAPVKTVPAPLSNNTTICRRNSVPALSAENRQWWYRPCGPLIVSASSCQKEVKVYDIRDGDQVMKWELQKPVVAMDYSSPLQWRNRGKVVVAEADCVSMWDVSSLNSQAVLSVSSVRNISAMHINNTDAELGGGIRQRTSSQETQGNDGVFCTRDSINVLDFRQSSSICMKITKVGVSMQSAFSHGDSIFVGCTSLSSVATKKHPCSQIQQLSLRQQKLVCTFTPPEPNNVLGHYTSLTQVWGDSSYVMGICGAGFYVFDALKEDDDDDGSVGMSSSTASATQVVASENMYDSPSFDYSQSRVLIISRDRPASWRYLL